MYIIPFFDRVAGSSDTLSVFHDEIARGQITESNLVTIGDIVEKSDGFGMSFLIMYLNGHYLFHAVCKNCSDIVQIIDL